MVKALSNYHDHTVRLLGISPETYAPVLMLGHSYGVYQSGRNWVFLSFCRVRRSLLSTMVFLISPLSCTLSLIYSSLMGSALLQEFLD